MNISCQALQSPMAVRHCWLQFLELTGNTLPRLRLSENEHLLGGLGLASRPWLSYMAAVGGGAPVHPFWSLLSLCLSLSVYLTFLVQKGRAYLLAHHCCTDCFMKPGWLKHILHIFFLSLPSSEMRVLQIPFNWHVLVGLAGI